MDVGKYFDTPINIHHFDKLFGIVNSWMQDFARIDPSSIKINSKKRTSVISVNDSVGIKHWHYFEYIIISENLGIPLVAAEKS